MTEPLTHVQRVLCCLVASGLDVPAASRRLAVPLRTAQRVLARDDAKALVVEKRTNGLGWREVLEMDLYATNSVDRRRAAVELARLERSAPEESAGARVTVRLPGPNGPGPAHSQCPTCGFHTISTVTPEEPIANGGAVGLLTLHELQPAD